MNNKTLTVYISNMSEDVWPFIQSMSDPYVRLTELTENAALAEHDLFSFIGESNVLMFFPKPVSRFYFEYFLTFSKSKNIRLAWPGIHTGSISTDILSDRRTFEHLIAATKKYENVEIISYCNSSQFYRLLAEIRKSGIKFSTPESPFEADSWVVDFFGSKSGIRQLSQQSGVAEPDFKMPPGLISVDIENTAKMAAKMYIKDKSLVIKTNKGHAGAGLYILRENDLPNNYQKCVDEILRLFRKESYWSRFPIITEKYIEPAQSVGGGYPNAEFRINANGRIEFLYFCALRVSKEGIFKGVEINNSVMSDQDEVQIIDTGFFLGEQLASRGYRGYYEMDYVASKNGDIFVTESNVRRTGGTHAYHLARALFGRDFMTETYIVTNNMYPLPKDQRNIEEQQFFKRLKPVLFDFNKKEGVVIPGTRLLEHNYFGYVLFAKNKARANKIEAEMERLLNG